MITSKIVNIPVHENYNESCIVQEFLLVSSESKNLLSVINISFLKCRNVDKNLWLIFYFNDNLYKAHKKALLPNVLMYVNNAIFKIF